MYMWADAKTSLDQDHVNNKKTRPGPGFLGIMLVPFLVKKAREGLVQPSDQKGRP